MVIAAFIFGVLISAMATFIVFDHLETKREKKRLKKVEEEFLKRLHHKHKLKKPGEINEL